MAISTVFVYVVAREEEGVEVGIRDISVNSSHHDNNNTTEAVQRRLEQQAQEREQHSDSSLKKTPSSTTQTGSAGKKPSSYKPNLKDLEAREIAGRHTSLGDYTRNNLLLVTDTSTLPKLSFFKSFWDKFVTSNYEYRIDVLQSLEARFQFHNLRLEGINLKELKAQLTGDDVQKQNEAKKEIDRLYKENSTGAFGNRIRSINASYKRALNWLDKSLSMFSGKDAFKINENTVTIGILSFTKANVGDYNFKKEYIDTLQELFGNPFSIDIYTLNQFLDGNITLKKIKTESNNQLLSNYKYY